MLLPKIHPNIRNTTYPYFLQPKKALTIEKSFYNEITLNLFSGRS